MILRSHINNHKYMSKLVLDICNSVMDKVITSRELETKMAAVQTQVASPVNNSQVAMETSDANVPLGPNVLTPAASVTLPVPVNESEIVNQSVNVNQLSSNDNNANSNLSVCPPWAQLMSQIATMQASLEAKFTESMQASFSNLQASLKTELHVFEAKIDSKLNSHLTQFESKLDVLENKISNQEELFQSDLNTISEELVQQSDKCSRNHQQLQSQLDNVAKQVAALNSVSSSADGIEVAPLVSRLEAVANTVIIQRNEFDQELEGVKKSVNDLTNELSNLQVEVGNNTSKLVEHQLVNFERQISSKTDAAISQVVKSINSVHSKVAALEFQSVPSVNTVAASPSPTLANDLHNSTSNAGSETFREPTLSQVTTVPNLNTPASVAAILSHPLRNLGRNEPKFAGMSHENPATFIKKFEEYMSFFQLTEAEALKFIPSCLKDSAFFWYDLIKTKIETWPKFKDSFLSKFWNDRVQGGIRARLHMDKFNPTSPQALDEHLSRAYAITRYMTFEMSPAEFVAIILTQLPHKYQLHWAGRQVDDIQQFQEELLAFCRLDLSVRHQNQRDRDRSPPSHKNPDQHKTVPYRTWDRPKSPNQWQHQAHNSQNQHSGTSQQQHKYVNYVSYANPKQGYKPYQKNTNRNNWYNRGQNFPDSSRNEMVPVPYHEHMLTGSGGANSLPNQFSQPPPPMSAPYQWGRSMSTVNSGLNPGAPVYVQSQMANTAPTSMVYQIHGPRQQFQERQESYFSRNTPLPPVQGHSRFQNLGGATYQPTTSTQQSEVHLNGNLPVA